MSLYSHSRLSCFEQCPLKFKLNYIDKIKPEFEETVETFLGSMAHEVLEKLYKNLKFQKLTTISELLEYFNKQWKENWNDSIIIVRKEYTGENFRKMGVKFLTDYYNRYKPFNQSRTVGLETQDSIDLDNNYKIHIRIDRLTISKDNIYEIHDYKTSNSLPTQEKLDHDRQLALYAYGIKKMYPDAKRVKLIWHYLAFDKEMASERTSEQLEELRKQVIELIKRIEATQDFPGRQSALCGWCGFQEICPEWKHKFITSNLQENEYLKEDGVKLVNEFAKTKEESDKLSEKLDKIREALVSYAKKENITAVFGSDYKASVKSYPKLSFPKKYDLLQQKFFETIKQIGLWDKLATIDVYELAKMINNGELHSELVSLLNKYISRGETVRINLRKK